MFKISGNEVYSYSYNEEKELLTFYDACGRSVCDVSFSKEQYDEEIISVWDTKQDRFEALGELLGDSPTNREWLLNLPLKEFIEMCSGNDISDDKLYEFICGVESDIYPDTFMQCNMCSYFLADNAECNDVNPDPSCKEGFELWLDEVHRDA